jgi:hypothetical protein
MTTASIKIMPRKPPAKRLFSGMAGSPLAHVNEESTAEPAPKSAAAIRAQRWRDKQKQDPGFKKKEVERKQTERTEAEHNKQLNQLLESGQFPISLAALRFKTGPALWLKDAPQGVGKLVTGGYDTAKMGTVEAEHIKAELGRVTPKGHGPDDSKSLNDTEKPSAYLYIPPKEVSAMRNFIRNRTTTSPMMKCLRCDEQIAPAFSFASGFNHLHDRHPDDFEEMMRRVHSAKICSEDHAGMIERHGRGTRKLYCGKCRKLLWKPGKPKRSDRPSDIPKAA